MNIHLVGLRPSSLEAMIQLHRVAEPPKHELVSDAGAADMIIFIGSVPAYGDGIVDSPLPRLYPEKCFMYWDDDAVVPLLPGIYTNAVMPGWFDLHRTASHMFIDALNPHVVPMPGAEKRYLFSFAGGSTSLVRKKLYKIDFRRPDVLVRNTSDYFHWDPSQEDRDERQKKYAETIAASHFGLCPRGASAGSLRLFEVMQIGVAPVLVSDKFMLPDGPDWDSFLIRVPERKIKHLAEILESHISESAERGRLARLAWEQWFSPPVMFNNIVATFATMAEQRKIPERWIHPFWGYILWRRRFYNSVRGLAKNAVLGIFRILRLRFIYEMNQR
jgi:Exostosin family